MKVACPVRKGGEETQFGCAPCPYLTHTHMVDHGLAGPAAPWPSVSRTMVSALWPGLTEPTLGPIPSPYRSNGPSGAASSLLVSARGDGSTAVNRLVCSDQGTPVCLSAMTSKILSHNIPAYAIMRRNFHINPRIRGLISTFTVEVSGRLSEPMSI